MLFTKSIAYGKAFHSSANTDPSLRALEWSDQISWSRDRDLRQFHPMAAHEAGASRRDSLVSVGGGELGLVSARSASTGGDASTRRASRGSAAVTPAAGAGGGRGDGDDGGDVESLRGVPGVGETPHKLRGARRGFGGGDDGAGGESERLSARHGEHAPAPPAPMPPVAAFSVLGGGSSGGSSRGGGAPAAAPQPPVRQIAAHVAPVAPVHGSATAPSTRPGTTVGGPSTASTARNEKRVDISVEETLLNEELGEHSDEFSRLEYTGYTFTQPAAFDDLPRAARPPLSRKIKCFICVTASSEEKEVVKRTLDSISNSMPNLSDMGIRCQVSPARQLIHTYVFVAWPGRAAHHFDFVLICQDVLVLLIFDGVSSIDKSTIMYLEDIGIYDGANMEEAQDGLPVLLHAFERSVHLTKTRSQDQYYMALQVRTKCAIWISECARRGACRYGFPNARAPNGYPNARAPQLVLALKQEATSVINSHMWFLDGYCRVVRGDAAVRGLALHVFRWGRVCVTRSPRARVQVRPEFVFFIDCGNVVEPRALSLITQCFLDDPHVGGATGEIVGLNSTLANVFEGSAMFEMRTGYCFDLPMESVCGWVEGLSDEFAAYRYAALEGEPLRAYVGREICIRVCLGAFATAFADGGAGTSSRRTRPWTSWGPLSRTCTSWATRSSRSRSLRSVGASGRCASSRARAARWSCRGTC